MTYKGYEAVVEFDEEARSLSGEVINTRDVITFHGDSVEELEKEFRKSVDDYLKFCKSRGEKPDKPFSGNFVVRTTAELHRQIALEARREGKSLNSYVVGRLMSKKIMAA